MTVEKQHEGRNLPAEEPIENPGLPSHTWRPTDVDERAEKRAERQVASLFLASIVFTLLFAVSYFYFEIGENPDTLLGFGASNVALGVTLGMALLLIGVGVIQWARKLMADHEMVEMRHPIASSEDDRQESLTALGAGLQDSGIGRRPLIRNTLLGAIGVLGIPAVVALRDLGPLPGDKLYSTVWEPGMRLARDVIGTPIKPEDLVIGDLVNGEPMILFEPDGPHGTELQVAKSKAAIVIVKMRPEEIQPVEGREDWTVDGVICYSKICTHVGCPISLYEQQTHNVLCPCHQSTFDLADGARVVFGPAARPLPQLPLAVDDEGYLVAQSDFTEPVGPSFWERG